LSTGAKPVDMALCMRTHFCPCCGKIALHAGHGVRGMIGNKECPPNFVVRCPSCMAAKVEPDPQKYILAVDIQEGWYDERTEYGGRQIVFEVQ
jgi:hypothetical protein